jgi:hypothetical protein
MKKFIQIPLAIQEDIISGNLIGNDLVVYSYLVDKAGHGKPIYFSNNKIAGELGGMSYGKISASLNRLHKAKHILRKKTAGNTMTQLKTVVVNSKNILIKGRQHEDIC